MDVKTDAMIKMEIEMGNTMEMGVKREVKTEMEVEDDYLNLKTEWKIGN